MEGPQHALILSEKVKVTAIWSVLLVWVCRSY